MIDLDFGTGTDFAIGTPAAVPANTPHLCARSPARSLSAFTFPGVFLSAVPRRIFLTISVIWGTIRICSPAHRYLQSDTWIRAPHLNPPSTRPGCVHTTVRLFFLVNNRKAGTACPFSTIRGCAE